MIKQDDRLTVRSKVLDNLKTSFPWLGTQVRSLRISGHRKSSTAPLKEKPVEETKTDDKPQENEIALRLPTVQEVLEANAPQPLYAVLLGLCDDGLPLNLDLKNPAPGSVLIAGDHASGKTRLIHSILTSAALSNPREQVQYAILTPNPDEYTDLSEYDHCRNLINYTEPGPLRFFKEYLDEVENRRTNPVDLALVLVIEALDRFLKVSGPSQLASILHLVKHGPRSGVWVFATLAAEAVVDIDPIILDSFRTHLVGHIADSEQAAYLARSDENPCRTLIAGEQFSAALGGDWLPFWICDPAGS